MRRGRQARLLACGAALALAVAGCGGGGEGEGTSYSVAILEPQHLIPGDESEAYGLEVLYGLFEGLVSYDPKDGHPVDDVAQSITSKDQRHWTITIKKGWRFHNGEPVTAASFVGAWNAVAYGPNGWNNNYFFANVEGYDALNPEQEGAAPKAKTLSGLKVVDDYTFRVTLKAPFSQFPLTLGYAAFYPMPKAAFADLKAYEEKPIGNGPYKMVGAWRHDEAIRLTRYDDYAGAKAKVRDLTFKIYSNIETAYNDLLAGNLDIMPLLPPQRIADAAESFGDHFISKPSSAFTYLGFPLYDKRFQQQKLRQAFSMAIDREKIAHTIFNDSYVPAKSLVSPVVAGSRSNPCGALCAYDPKKAKQLFDEAGGFDGTLYLWYNSDGGHEQWMQAVANQLRQNLGIKDIRFKQQPLATYIPTLDSHRVTGPYRLGWSMDYPSPQDYLEPNYSSHGSANYTTYDNDKVDQLIDKGNAAPSVRAGITYYQQAEDVILKDMPVIPLWFQTTTAAYTSRVKNVSIDAFGFLATDRVELDG